MSAVFETPAVPAHDSSISAVGALHPQPASNDAIPAAVVDAPAAAAAEPAPVSTEAFAALGLHPVVLSGVAQAGYSTPTGVQAAAIPVLLTGSDAIVSSQTGSGKTAAFMLPALSRIAVGRDASPLEGAGRTGPRVLVLAPTRELADQSTRAATTYGRGLRRLNVVSVVGGMPYREQLQRLSRPVDVLVATPGRLIDHIQRGRIDLSNLQMLVLDEADRMLDMGFIEDIETIVAATSAERQTLLFSATMDARIQRLVARWMRDPQRIDVSSQQQSKPNIEERLYLADDAQHKDRLLEHVLADVSVKCAIVFAATKSGTEELANRLYERGHASAALHGDMQQRFRTRTLNALRRGELRVLVATDVAARGIDVADISHVVNFDLPMQAEDYVHRIGRTGRAGRAGLAVTFATSREVGKVRGIERFTQRSLPMHTVPGLEPRSRMPSPRDGDRRGGRPGFGRPGGRPGDGARSGYGGRPAGGFGRSSAGGRGEGGWGNNGWNAGQRGGSGEAGQQQRGFGGEGAPRGFGDAGAQRGFGGDAQRGAGNAGQRGFGEQRGYGQRAPADRFAQPGSGYQGRGGDRAAQPAGRSDWSSRAPRGDRAWGDRGQGDRGQGGSRDWSDRGQGRGGRGGWRD